MTSRKEKQKKKNPKKHLVDLMRTVCLQVYIRWRIPLRYWSRQVTGNVEWVIASFERKKIWKKTVI